METLKKTLKCGCTIEKKGKTWYAYKLCRRHRRIYYRNPYDYLEAINKAVK